VPWFACRAFGSLFLHVSREWQALSLSPCRHLERSFHLTFLGGMVPACAAAVGDWSRCGNWDAWLPVIAGYGVLAGAAAGFLIGTVMEKWFAS
jgi:hypothetical protein